MQYARLYCSFNSTSCPPGILQSYFSPGWPLACTYPGDIPLQMRSFPFFVVVVVELHDMFIPQDSESGLLCLDMAQ